MLIKLKFEHHHQHKPDQTSDSRDIRLNNLVEIKTKSTARDSFCPKN